MSSPLWDLVFGTYVPLRKKVENVAEHCRGNARRAPAVSSHMPSRRDVLRAGIFGALSLAGCGTARSRPAARDRARRAELARVIESSDRGDTLERIAPLLDGDGADRDLIAALFTAAVRHVVPREQFSKEHHALLCVSSVHGAAARVAPAVRWRPLLWAVDYFKWAQAETREAGERLEPLAPSALPAAADAELAFERAMEAFDGAAAEAAISALHRAGRRERVADLLARHASRDFRHIGHKVIYVANGLESLRLAGGDGAEETVRSIALTLALHYTEKERDLDGAWTVNRERAPRLRGDWGRGAPNDEAVRDLLATFRAADPVDASGRAVEWLERGVAASSVWDAIFLGAAEVMFDHPTGIEALHAVTAANAAYATFAASTDDTTRRLILLQTAARVADFRGYAARWAVKRNKPATFDLHIENLEPLAGAGLDEIFAEIGGEPMARMRAARRTLAYLDAGPGRARDFAARALELAVDRAADTHDLKLPVAAFEDHARVSPAWRGRYLAACTVRMRGAGDARGPGADHIAAVARRLA